MTTLYRNALPQLGDALFVTDGGIETALIFNDGITLVSALTRSTISLSAPRRRSFGARLLEAWA